MERQSAYSSFFPNILYLQTRKNMKNQLGQLVKTSLIIIAALMLTSFLSPKTNYQEMWNKVKKHLENKLPESAEKELDAIEKMALKDKDQVQLLKTVLYRQKIFMLTEEDNPQQAFIRYAESKLSTFDEANAALLHDEIAMAYSAYLNEHEWRIKDNLPIDGEINKVEMEYWDRKTFHDLIDQHKIEALKPTEALKQAKTSDYMVLYDEEDTVEKDNIEYEPSLFEFLFHRVANYYKENSSADDIRPEWNTERWWADAETFVKADLGNDASPLIKCLGIYQDLIVHNISSGNESALIYNDYKRIEFIHNILNDSEKYQKALENIQAHHPSNPLSAEITALIATDMIAEYQSHSSDSAYFEHYCKAKAMCEDAIVKFPKTKGAAECQDIIKTIEDPEIQIDLNKVQLPQENIPAILYYRNVQHPYYRIVKVSEKELKEMGSLNKEKLILALNKKKAVIEQEINLKEESDFRKHGTLIALPSLDYGFYFLIASVDKRNTSEAKTIVLSFQVSRLSYIIEKESNKMAVSLLGRKSGKPLEGVTVELCKRQFDYKERKHKVIVIAQKTSDKDGRVLLNNTTTSDSFYINLRKGDDTLLSENYYRFYTKENDNTYYSTTLFTDRAIYRPGQTVHFKGIVVRKQGKEQSLASGYAEKVSFKDANWQEITSAAFTTDEYGSFNGSFVIPADRLNGVFHLNANNGSTSLRVEEYKRPTFEVNFEHPKEQYKLNQEVTVRGSVNAYAGFGLDDVAYSYRIVRKTSFPWRCWWWYYPPIDDEQISYGNARTDENGKFAITFNLKPSLTTTPEKQPVFTYQIEVTATSAQGETHSKSFSIRAGYNEVAISTNLPKIIEKSDIDKYEIEVVNMSGQPAKSRISRKIYRYDDTKRIDYFESMRLKPAIDRQSLSDTELGQLFPNFSFYPKKGKTLVYEDEIVVDGKSKLYEGRTLKAGKYIVELKSADDPLAVAAAEFAIFDSDSKKMPYTSMTWTHADKTTGRPGEKIRFTMGSSAKEAEIRVQLVHGDEIRIDKLIKVSDGVQTLTYEITEQDRGGLCLRTAFVKENVITIDGQSVSVPFDNYDLDVKLATVRDMLNPGGEETWEVTVRDHKDTPVEAALLAGMYDASLDGFIRNHWTFSMSPSALYHNYFSGDRNDFISSQTETHDLTFATLFSFNLPSDAPFFDIGYFYRYGLVRGDVFAEKMVLENPSSAIMQASFDNDAKEEVMKEETDISSSDTDGDEISVSPKDEAENPIPAIRDNFNETAFFFPNLRSNADGSATFSFTMPDALTRWRLMLLAYTKDRKTGRGEYTLTSSKPVMIMADMPRYMYDSDTLWFVANVINTGEEAVTPEAKIEIFDAATMQPTNMLGSEALVPMETIAPGRSKEVRWKVIANPDSDLLAFRFTAYAGAFSDAEQHLLPILSSEIFMTQTLPITVKAETEKTFDFDAIASPKSQEREHSLTLNFSTNPVWYAVQSLPYLANLNTNRAETTFYVFYANTLSAYIAKNIPDLLNYIRKWQIETPNALLSQLEKDQDLKAIMLEETPWMLEAKSEDEQRSRIASLFEINTLREQQTSVLKRIAEKQKNGGGWPWMEGMPESPFISAHILGGMGKLIKMNATMSLSEENQHIIQSICKKAVKYLEYDVANTYRNMMKNGRKPSINSITLEELYALSFFEAQNADKDFAEAKKHYLACLEKEWTNFDFNMRSKGALTLYRNGKEKTAKLMIQSFKECAQKKDDIGMYWPKQYFSFASHIATHAHIMDAFVEIDKDQEWIDLLRVWLLTQKQTNKWENAASTAEAVYALLMQGSDWFAEDEEVDIKFGATPISTEKGVAGTGFIQRRWNANEVTEDMRHLTVDNPTRHLVWGGLFRQYFVPIDKVKSNESAFNIRRELFVEKATDKGKTLVPVTTQTLKVGDKLTVKITFESKQDMSFVFVKDLRAAGLEPIEQVSHYKYDDQMRYYQSNTDTDMRFFIEFLPKGTHQLEYSLFVTKEGNLSNGYALIQCQYAPEFSAYSDGMRIKINQATE